jgi:hypothetical protein
MQQVAEWLEKLGLGHTLSALPRTTSVLRIKTSRTSGYRSGMEAGYPRVQDAGFAGGSVSWRRERAHHEENTRYTARHAKVEGKQGRWR